MSSLKALFCDLCVILLFGLAVFADEKISVTTTDGTPMGKCSCGGFASITPPVDSAPLLSQTPGLVVKCDDEGQITCKSLCNALATVTKTKGPEILCSRLKEANELKLSAFYKTCENPWLYADMTAERPLCCVDAKVITCPSVEKLNTTTVDAMLVAKTVM